MASSTSSRPIVEVASLFMLLTSSNSERSLRSCIMPLSDKTNTVLSETSVAELSEATIPMMLITISAPVMMKKTKMPTTVADMYLRKSFII